MRTLVLHNLLVDERTAILARCEEKVLRFSGALAAHPPAQGWSVFYDDVVKLFDVPGDFSATSVSRSPLLMNVAELKHAHASGPVASGYTLAEVVFSYGIISEAIAELAEKAEYVLSATEHTQVNRLLDNVIATAVSVFEGDLNRVRDLSEAQRIGTLAHELRNSLQSATISLEMIGSGSYGANSNTSDALQQSLQRMGELIDKTLTEVRLRVEPVVHLVDIALVEVISEIAVTAGFVARKKGISLVIQGQYDLVVHADRQLLLAALSNLLQNAIKYSAANSTVRIVAQRHDDTVTIDVEDHCGGLPPGIAEEMFKPFVQRSSDRTGIGLGLTISRKAIESCNGQLRVRDIPGEGCVFTVELPAGGHDALGLIAPATIWP